LRPALLLALAAASPAMAAETITVEDLARRLQALEQRLDASVPPAQAGPADARAAGTLDPVTLDQRLRVLERKLELQAEEATTRAATQPTVKLDGKGLSIKSPAADGIELRFKGLVQADGRVYLGDDAIPQNDTFLLRRVEPTLEGSWGPLLGFRLQAQLAGDTATLNDAYVDLRFDPRATLRIGKFKAPVGLEQLQSSSGLAAIERGLPTELAPGRDYGVQLQGESGGGTLNYAAGVFNGTPDGRDGASSNPDNEFEYAGRVFWEPFKDDANAWSGLGFGIAASVGDKSGSGDGVLPRYRTPGQAKYFNSGSAVGADGRPRRWSPQRYYYAGPFGLLAEYIVSAQELRLASGANAGLRRDIGNDAYGVTASVVLTGEDASYKGVARPDHPFTIGAAGWGALELVARYGRLEIDDAVFPWFADPARSAAQASSWGLGLNWYLTSHFKLVANYTQTTFEGGAAGGLDREDEQAFFTRAQFSF
jgi:phosphate-selective porin OprO/OprP